MNLKTEYETVFVIFSVYRHGVTVSSEPIPREKINTEVDGIYRQSTPLSVTIVKIEREIV